MGAKPQLLIALLLLVVYIISLYPQLLQMVVEHFGKKGTGMLLVPGMTFTIEPMINMGTHEVFVDEEDDWTVVTEDELPSAQWEHTFVMTENGLEILTY